MKTAFVTGATGFVGSTLVDDLLDRGFSVKCATRKSSDLRWLKDKDVQLCEVNLLDLDSIKEALRGCRYIFHLAGVLFASSEEEFIRGNVEITENMVEAAIQSDTEIERFVLVSSIVAAGASASGKPLVESDPCRPFTWYGKSKFASEKYVLSRKDMLPFTIIRPGAVFGPRDYAMFTAFQMGKIGLNIILGEKGKQGSIIHVSDLSRGILNAAFSDKAVGETYFLANDKFIYQEDFVRTIIQIMGKNPKNIVIPYSVLMVAAYLSEFYSRIFKKKALLNQQKMLEFREPYIVCSSEKAKRDFNFQQKISLEEGIKSTLAWYKENKWI
ncbi:MAG: NAD-dependent epimerase/dehydratase family protein [Spirochaetaceae bacterium]|nr:NAD-dependent epimerase/dehydratase family protein [Spirochaetaceae bacterium]